MPTRTAFRVLGFCFNRTTLAINEVNKNIMNVSTHILLVYQMRKGFIAHIIEASSANRVFHKVFDAQ